MKNSTLFTLLLAFCFNAQINAQIEHSILDSGLVWRYVLTGGISDPISNSDFRLSQSETLVNGKNYHNWDNWYYFSQDTLENEIWVYYSGAEIEIKIIDFKLNVGDSIDLSALNSPVKSIRIMDTLNTIALTSGELRNAMKVELYYDEFNWVQEIYWIDGIGSSQGLEYFNTGASLSPTSLACIFDESNGVETIYGNCALGIDELENFKLSVWPNPASDLINIETDSPMEEIRVYDQIGSLVGSWQYAVGSSLEQIDISSSKPGLYFLMVKTEKGVETKKFIKSE